MPHNRLTSSDSFKTSSFVLRPPCLGASPSFEQSQATMQHKRPFLMGPGYYHQTQDNLASHDTSDHHGSSGRGPAYKRGKMVQISPFQPVLHQRNFPRGGLCVVSPYHHQDLIPYHHANTATTNTTTTTTRSTNNQPDDDEHHDADASTVLTQDTEDHPPPPVSEIRVPTPIFGVPTNATAAHQGSSREEDYQTQYLSASKDLYRAHKTIDQLQKDKQHLQRQLFQLQCRLWQQERHKPVRNDRWSVPDDDRLNLVATLQE